jgi:hypothetical protein
LLVLFPDVAGAGCRHTGLSADELLRLVREQSQARTQTSVRDLDGKASAVESPAAPLLEIVPLPCDSSAPHVKSVVSSAFGAVAAPCDADAVPHITWLVTVRPRLVPNHASPADPSPPRA